MIGYGNNYYCCSLFLTCIPLLVPLLKEKTHPRTPPYDGGE